MKPTAKQNKSKLKSCGISFLPRKGQYDGSIQKKMLKPKMKTRRKYSSGREAKSPPGKKMPDISRWQAHAVDDGLGKWALKSQRIVLEKTRPQTASPTTNQSGRTRLSGIKYNASYEPEIDVEPEIDEAEAARAAELAKERLRKSRKAAAARIRGKTSGGSRTPPVASPTSPKTKKPESSKKKKNPHNRLGRKDIFQKKAHARSNRTWHSMAMPLPQKKFDAVTFRRERKLGLNQLTRRNIPDMQYMGVRGSGGGYNWRSRSHEVGESCHLVAHHSKTCTTVSKYAIAQRVSLRERRRIFTDGTGTFRQTRMHPLCRMYAQMAVPAG